MDKKNKKYKFKKGFSMEELIVVCAIIGIMTTAVLVSMRGNKNERAVETSAREVAAAIRQAQNYALTGKGADGTCTNYTFTCATGSPNYSIGGCVDINYTLKNGVKFRTGDGSDCVADMFAFTLPHGTTESITTNKKIILEDRNNGNPYTICVYKEGNVKELSGSGGC